MYVTFNNTDDYTYWRQIQLHVVNRTINCE